MKLQNNLMQNKIRITFTRDSVCMGDDCMAPHKCEMLFGTTDKVIDLLNEAARYVPPMNDFRWEVLCDTKLLGTLISDSQAKYRIETNWTNELISSLSKQEIFCREKINPEYLSYLERIEVLYDGEYFDANVFDDYKNVGMILEEEETKITTQDKEFALRHGFEFSVSRSYDKILPIEQFEGLRIHRIPNNSHAKVIVTDIPKENIMVELHKRAKSPHDFITDGVLAYGVNVGRLVFEEEGFVVYVISDLPHIGPSDVFMVYQISKENYDRLLSMCDHNKIPKPPVPSSVTNDCRLDFLCGESAYCKRFYCSLDDVDKAYIDRISTVSESSQHKQVVVSKYCPSCGKKNSGDKYCRDCGTKLFK